MPIKDNIELVRRNIDTAMKQAGRSDQCLLVAVTKLHDTEEINEAIDCGITDIAENKVQEIIAKYDRVKPVRWHLIGHLQTNKVKYIIDKVVMIHSVDSLHLAAEISRQALKAGRTMDVLIQVNTANEESKFGVSAEETEPLIREILETCPNVRVRGIMCIAPFSDDQKEIGTYFRMAKELYDGLAGIDHPNLDFSYLSMGMSNDYETAIREGSNLVRVGTVIFGHRDYTKKQGN